MEPPIAIQQVLKALRQLGYSVASQAAVGRGIHRAIQRKRDIVYLPWFWRPIMFLVTSIPEALFKRLRL